MADFAPAIAVVLRHEGGWVNDAADPGGETNFGISQVIIRAEGITAAELGLPDFSPGSMKLLTVEAAKKVYRRCFWDRYSYGALVDQTVATKLFDTAVNIGPARAHRLAQLTANAVGVRDDVGVDGVLGPKSLTAINACVPSQWLSHFAERQAVYYRNLATQRPTLKKFLSNWLKRAAWVG